jgi:glycerate dehydrogenase
VDVVAARKHGITVSNVPIYGTSAVAQFTFALMLELCHHVGLHDQLVHHGEWAKRGEFCFWNTPLVELAGKRMGILGFGRIGRRVGEIANAMGMEVLAYDHTPGTKPDYEPFEFVNLDTLFTQSDVVSLHCPQTAENKEMVNRRLLHLMKPSAMLINTSRGLLVHEADLAEALNNGTIASAAVDVVSREPINNDNPLLAARNLLITPHIAWATLSARRRLMETTAQNVAAFISGKPVHVVS